MPRFLSTRAVNVLEMLLPEGVISAGRVRREVTTANASTMQKLRAWHSQRDRRLGSYSGTQKGVSHMRQKV